MNTNYNNQSEVIFQTDESSHCREWCLDHSKYELAEYLFSERKILEKLFKNLKESYYYHLSVYHLIGVEEFVLDFNDFSEIEKIEELEVDVIKSKLNLLKEEVEDSKEMESIEDMFNEVEEIEISIRTTQMFIRYLKN
jgi:hypothetical protein